MKQTLFTLISRWTLSGRARSASFWFTPYIWIQLLLLTLIVLPRPLFFNSFALLSVSSDQFPCPYGQAIHPCVFYLCEGLLFLVGVLPIWPWFLFQGTPFCTLSYQYIFSTTIQSMEIIKKRNAYTDVSSDVSLVFLHLLLIGLGQLLISQRNNWGVGLSLNFEKVFYVWQRSLLDRIIN